MRLNSVHKKLDRIENQIGINQETIPPEATRLIRAYTRFKFRLLERHRQGDQEATVELSRRRDEGLQGHGLEEIMALQAGGALDEYMDDWGQIGGYEMTKTNETKQIHGNSGLTERQIKVIPKIVASHTYSEGCRKARINRTTLYKWLHDPAFKAEMDRRRDQITQEGFSLLAQSLTRAVEVLTGLLGNKDKRLARLAAKDVVEHFVRCKEMQELDSRLAAIEEHLRDQDSQRH